MSVTLKLDDMPPEMLVKFASHGLEQWRTLQLTNKRLKVNLRSCLFTGNARTQALRLFSQLAWISETQRADLAQDDTLPWSEEVVLRHAGLTPRIRFELLRPSTIAMLRQRFPVFEEVIQTALEGRPRHRHVQFLEVPWGEIPFEPVTVPRDNCRMCTWGDHVLLHSYQYPQLLFICEPIETNGRMTLVPRVIGGQQYADSVPMFMHVHGDTLFTSGNGDFKAIDLRTGVRRSFYPRLATNQSILACTDEYLWMGNFWGVVQVWDRTTMTQMNYDIPVTSFELAAWRHIGFVLSRDGNVIHVLDGSTGATIRTLHTNGVLCLAVLDNKMLCAANDLGQIEAWSLLDWTHLWTCSLPVHYACTCLTARGMGLLYAGTVSIHQDQMHIFAAVDDAGHVVHSEFLPEQICDIANTHTAVFALEREYTVEASLQGGQLHVWRA